MQFLQECRHNQQSFQVRLHVCSTEAARDAVPGPDVIPITLVCRDLPVGRGSTPINNLKVGCMLCFKAHIAWHCRCQLCVIAQARAVLVDMEEGVVNEVRKVQVVKTS